MSASLKLARPAAALLCALVACAPARPSVRSLHYIDGELVQSAPVTARGYEAYLRARLALDSVPPNLDEAYEAIAIALRYDPAEPHLWTTRAEIEMRSGEVERAMASLVRALALRPGYPPASRMLVRIEGQDTASRETP